MNIQNFSAIACLGFVIACPVQAQISWQPNFNLAPMILQAAVLNPCANEQCNDSEQNRPQTANKGPRVSTPSVTKLTEAGQLRFTPNLETRKALISQTIALAEAQSPVSAIAVKRSLTAVDPVVAAGRRMAPVGLATNNMADAMALFLTSTWTMSRGSTQLPSKSHVLGVKTQAAQILLANAGLAEVTNTQKQRYAETLLIQTGLLEATFIQLSKDPKGSAQFSAELVQLVTGMGIDLRAVTVSDQGFIRPR